MRVRVLTFNAAIQDVRIFGRSLYCPVHHAGPRLMHLPSALFRVDADVICLQEMYHRRLQNRLYRELRNAYPYSAGLHCPGPRLRLGNELLVFSRFPITQSCIHRFRSAAAEELRFSSRGFLHATIHFPGVGDVDLVNFHATAGGIRDHPESAEMESIRNAQIRQMCGQVAGSSRVILAGDLNAGPHSSVENYRTILEGGMVDAFEASGGTGYTWDPANPLVALGTEAALPPQRIDHVILSRDLAGAVQKASARIVLQERAVHSSDGYVPLSDHYGVVVELHFEGKRSIPASLDYSG